MTWTKVGTDGMPGLPQNDLWVSRVEASHHTRGLAYATVDGHRMAKYSPWVFKTTDYGKTLDEDLEQPAAMGIRSTR